MEMDSMRNRILKKAFNLIDTDVSSFLKLFSYCNGIIAKLRFN